MTMKVPGAKSPIKTTLLTDATRVHADWYQPISPPSAPTPPNWERWIYVPSIELGKAIALTLDIDPACLSSGKHLIPDDFKTRLVVAIEHLRPGGVLSDFSGKARENSIVVTLQGVAQLANFCGWTLPPEFPKPEPVSARAEAEPASNAGTIPGKLPRVAVGRLAVKAAWEIELEVGRAATANDVMKRLQSWADEGKEPEYLIRSDRKKRCVIWNAGRKEKEYDEEACSKTIQVWMKSRR